MTASPHLSSGAPAALPRRALLRCGVLLSGLALVALGCARPAGSGGPSLPSVEEPTGRVPEVKPFMDHMQPIINEIGDTLDQDSLAGMEAKIRRLAETARGIPEASGLAEFNQRRGALLAAIEAGQSAVERRDLTATKAAFGQIRDACSRCHAVYRKPRAPGQHPTAGL